MTKEELTNALINIRHKMQKSDEFSLKENDIIANLANLILKEF